MRASAAPETARPPTKIAIVGARAEMTCATTNRPRPQRSTGRGPTRSVQPPDQAMAMVNVTSVAPVDAPNRAHPSSSRTTVGRMVMTARFSKAARVTSAMTPMTTGRWARSSSRTGASPWGSLAWGSLAWRTSVTGAGVGAGGIRQCSNLKCT